MGCYFVQIAVVKIVVVQIDIVCGRLQCKRYVRSKTSLLHVVVLAPGGYVDTVEYSRYNMLSSISIVFDIISVIRLVFHFRTTA